MEGEEEEKKKEEEEKLEEEEEEGDGGCGVAFYIKICLSRLYWAL